MNGVSLDGSPIEFVDGHTMSQGIRVILWRDGAHWKGRAALPSEILASIDQELEKLRSDLARALRHKKERKYIRAQIAALEKEATDTKAKNT